MTPTVSVILPVYNNVKFFRQTMESLASQTFKDFEIIIIDDCSYDGVEKQIDVYGQLPNIRVIRHPENRGVAESLNDGLIEAQGKYRAIQHADDISLPFRLEKEVQYLDEHPNIYLVGTWMQYIDESSNVLPKDGWWLRQVKYISDDAAVIHNKLLEMNCLVHTSVMFRKEIAGLVGFYDPHMVPAEDYDYWLKISEKHDIGIIREVLVQYRRHHKQISNLDNGQLMKVKAAEAILKAKRRRGL